MRLSCRRYCNISTYKAHNIRRAESEVVYVQLEHVIYIIKFSNVLCVYCSEVELEEILTVYTRLSRSASIFLRSNSRPVSSSVNSAPRSASGSSSACLSPVKGQVQGRDTSPGKPRAKDQSGDSRAKHSPADKHEGALHV